MKTKLLKVGLSLFVVLVFAWAAYQWFGRTHSAEQKFAETVEKSQYGFGQYFNAGYVPARTAMLDHILLLDKLSAESGRPVRNPYFVDAMAWYVCLAKLEETNNGSGKAEYMHEACARCEELGRSDCSEENLRRQIGRMHMVALANLIVGAP
ncbi:MAG: hypothetical protein AABN33_07440 [Acidobacteriota bacterium]